MGASIGLANPASDTRVQSPFGPEALTGCYPYTVARTRLQKNFREVPVARGVSSNRQSMFEMYMSPSGATWTWLVTTVNGCSSIVSVGVNMDLPLTIPGQRL